MLLVILHVLLFLVLYNRLHVLSGPGLGMDILQICNVAEIIGQKGEKKKIESILTINDANAQKMVLEPNLMIQKDNTGTRGT